MLFTEYHTPAGLPAIFYPPGQEELAARSQQEVVQAGQALGQLLDLPLPAMEVLLIAPSDWQRAPRDEEEEAPGNMLPYWTDATQPSTLVIPQQMDEIVGEATPEKRSLLLYHELAHAFLETDARPWPDESPLWADEWQLQFAAFWLFKQSHGADELITEDLHKQFAESFEPEADGKTPVTIRGFQWY